MNVLVFADSCDGSIIKSSYEAASYGAKIAMDIGGSASIVTYGKVNENSLKELGNYGITKIQICESLNHLDPQMLAKLVESAATSTHAEVIVFSHDFTGKSVAPILAAKMKAGLVSGAIDNPDLSNGFSVKKAVFSGKAFANIRVNSAIKVISLMPNSVGKTRVEGNAQISKISPDLGNASVTVKEFKPKGGDGINLSDAELVVSAGRGMKGPENWGMIEELAKELGAATACSRPVADIHWRPHHEHVGQTGLAIRPNLYIAIGISGAIQHLAGVNGSKVIVVINTDKEAPFFKTADYGIIGDAFEVVPKLIQAVAAFKAAQA